MITKQPQGEANFDFPGITVRIPDQGKWVKVIEKPLPNIEDVPGDENFTPIRLIINIAIIDVTTESVLTQFDPPVEIHVGYLVHDVFGAARLPRSLKLAYWDADNSVWVVFTPENHRYRLLPPSTGQVGSAQFSGWASDPVVAWGG